MRSRKTWIAAGMAVVMSVTAWGGAFSPAGSCVNAEEMEIVLVDADTTEGEAADIVAEAETSETTTAAEEEAAVIVAEAETSGTAAAEETAEEAETELTTETEAEDSAFVIEISEEETSGIEDEDLASIVANEDVTFDSSAWQYNSSSDVYYQTGVVYCNDPYDTTYETFGIYVPGAYMNNNFQWGRYIHAGQLYDSRGGKLYGLNCPDCDSGEHCGVFGAGGAYRLFFGGDYLHECGNHISVCGLPRKGYDGWRGALGRD